MLLAYFIGDAGPQEQRPPLAFWRAALASRDDGLRPFSTVARHTGSDRGWPVVLLTDPALNRLLSLSA